MKKIILFVCMLFSLSFAANAQSWLDRLGNTAKEAAKNAVERKVESKAEEVTDKAMDKAEETVKESAKGNKRKAGKATDEMSEEDTEENEAEGDVAVKFSAITQYDFVPGDRILYFEDFSQDAVGDFPALWTSNGSGEVKTVNIALGKWFHMTGEDAVHCYTKTVDFPDNFIIEFDIIPENEDGTQLIVYEEDPENPKEINSDLFPGKSGLQVMLESTGWETRGYSVNPDKDWIDGRSTKNPVVLAQVNHVIIWIQKRRVRIYHQGDKTLDIPTNIYAHTRFNKFLFSGWSRESTPYISNLKITTASSDTRSKLITDGKLVTYGITFDVNKADVKPESYGTLKSIADVLAENPEVKVKIVGHTDSDGDDAKNMDLSRQRAESVKNEIAKNFGVDTARMTTGGAGETAPVVANDSPENKAKNRRVEFVKL